MTPPKSILGVVAGGGALPALAVAACRRAGRDVFVVALEGQADPSSVTDAPHAWVRLGAAGRAIRRLRAAGAAELMFVGTVQRPSLAALRPDWWTARFLARTGAFALGDDGLLSAIIRTLENEEGFRVVGIENVVPDLLAPEGVLGRIVPDPVAAGDIRVAMTAARALGATDIGQAAVARDGIVIGREDAAGTDTLLARIEQTPEGAVGVLAKASKPRQELRIDRPTIGVETVRAAARAGLKGIAVEAGGGLMLDRAAVIATADALGIFVVGVRAGDEYGPDEPSPLVFLVAGEPSGDILGARLMVALKHATQGRVRFAGVGGTRMEAEGMHSLFPISEIAVMGLAEVVPRIPKLLARIREVAAHARVLAPAVVVTIDSPDFSFRVAARLKGQGTPLVHYVAPSVWAWRPGRARTIARRIDRLMALLPFEPPYFEREGLACTFVGHPVLESGAEKGDGTAFRRRHQIPNDSPLLCLLPGSRAGEVRALLSTFAATLAQLQHRRPGLRAVVPAAPAVAGIVRLAVAHWDKPPLVIEGEIEKFDAFAASTVALAASGTVALELAMAGTPAVIAYRVNPFTAWLARRLVRVKFVSLVNLILGRGAVPELLQEDCRPHRLAGAVGHLLDDPAAREAQRAAYREALVALGQGDPSPSTRAAEVVLRIMGRYVERKGATEEIRRPAP